MLNARSIKNKTLEFADLVREHDLDVIGISETWLTPNDSAVIADFTPCGYSFHHVTQANKRGGGVGLMTRSSIDVKINPKPQIFGSFESLGVELAHSNRLVIIYRPPGSTAPFSTFLDEFTSLIDSYLYTQSSLIITGDFNIHVDNSSTSTYMWITHLMSIL